MIQRHKELSRSVASDKTDAALEIFARKVQPKLEAGCPHRSKYRQGAKLDPHASTLQDLVHEMYLTVGTE